MSQKCKDCNGMGWNQLQPERPYVISCPTCEGKGGILHTGPYRLSDGTWSDGVDRGSKLAERDMNPERWEVWKNGRFWIAGMSPESRYIPDHEREFPIHAQAIAYADAQARTTTNGETK